MNRLFTLAVTVLMVVGTVGAMPGVLAQSTATTPTTTSTPTDASSTSDGNTTISPGERMAGVVGVGEAEVSGEVSARAFAFAVANASTNESRAAIIGRQLGELDQRLATLRERRQALQQAHQNGSISEGRYRAETARLVAQTRSVKRLANGTENASRGLPTEILRRNGVNATAIDRLRMNANELTGPEVAAIARTIAGPRAGTALGRGPPSGLVGPPEGRGPQVGGNTTMPGPAQGGQHGPPGSQTAGPNQGPAPGSGPGSGPQGPPGASGNRSDGANRGGQRGAGG